MEARHQRTSPAAHAAGACLFILSMFPATVPATPAWATEDLASERPRGVVTLDDALAAALRWHPDLGAAALEVRARDAAVEQASLFPNPELRAEVEDFAGSRARAQFEQTQTTISIGQRLEIGGKRAGRRTLAESERTLAEQENSIVRADITYASTAAFYELVAAQERLALVDDLIRLNRRALVAAEAQVAAGAAPPFEATRARLTSSRAEGLRLQIEAQLASARARLAATWGATTAGFDSARGPLPPADPPPSLDEVLEMLRAAPLLATRTAEIERRQAALGLQKTRRVPDVTVRLGGRHFNNDDTNALVAEVSVPLPLFDRNQGAVREAAERLEQARFEIDGVRAAVHAAAVSTFEQLRAAFQRWSLLRDRLVPDATHAHEQADAAYRRGAVRQLDVLDAQRTLFDLRLEAVDVLVTHHIARADLARLTGTAVVPGGEGEVR